MKIKPMLGDFLLEHLEYIESSESRALVEHRVPGLTGSYFQDMGTVPTTITIAGSKSGDEVRDSFLVGIRAIFNAGEPTTFVADINTATDLTEVVIEDLQVAEISGSADSFRYLIKLRKYIEPPEPPPAGLLDSSILDDAMSLVDALDAIDALSSISNLGDPTPPVRQALDAVKVATGGLDSVVNDLNGLFAKDLAATPALPPEMGEIASPPPVPPAEELRLDPADPRIDAETGTAIQRLLEAPETAAAAATLVRGVQGGAVAGILGEDAEAARQLAAAYGTQPSQLIPAGQDAALVLDPAFPLEAPPTILLRSGIGGDPARLGAALAEVGRTFDLFQLHEVGPCDSTAAAIPVQNLVPSTFCQVPAPVPGIPPGPTPEVGPAEIDPAAPDLQIDPADPRIDVGAKFALQRMIKNPGMAVDAACLIRGINGGTLAGIYGDDLAAAVKVARAHGTERWLLVPKGEDAALVLDATAPLDAPPTVIFRGDTPDIRSTPTRIDPALQKASQTFKLFQQGEIALCDSTGSAIPVSNLVPSSFCQVVGGDLIVVVTEEGINPNLPGPGISGAQVEIEGPSPSTEKASTLTDETGTGIFPNLGFGSYRMKGRKEGFEDAGTEIVHPRAQVQKASLESGSTLQSIGFPSSVLLQLRPSSHVKRYITTIAPGIIDDPAPDFRFQEVASGQSAIMHVLAGSHNAVTLLNVSGSISSNNQHVIEDKDIIDVPRGANRRDLFFYCKNLVDPNLYNPDTTLLELPIPSGKWPLVQVRVHKIKSTKKNTNPPPSSITKCMLIKLYGSSMLLNGNEIGRPHQQITNCYDINPNQFPHGTVSPKDVIDLVVKQVLSLRRERRSPTAKLNHLVINCHGYPDFATNNFTLCLGTGFDITNLVEWIPLQNMVDYIWAMNCSTTLPHPQLDQLFGRIAMATGAWVTRWEGSLWICPWGSWPTNHIDFYHQNPSPKHYDPHALNLNPVQPDSFFRSARFAQSGQLKSDLHFNIVRDPRMNYP